MIKCLIPSQVQVEAMQIKILYFHNIGSNNEMSNSFPCACEGNNGDIFFVYNTGSNDAMSDSFQ